MAGYTRTDTTNNIADGNIINATDLDNEFDGIQAAFNSSTGHNHDGTTGEGAPILVLGPSQDVVVGASTVTPKTTNTVDIGSSSLKFKDLYLAGNASFGGTLAVTGVATFTAQPVLSSLTASRAVFTDGSKGLVSNAITGTGNVVMSASPTLTGTVGGENATLSGTLGVTGVATFTAQPVVSSLTASRAVFTDSSKGLVSNAITGTGDVVMSNSPTLVTPALGTPSAVTLTNATGLPISTGVSGLGTGVATALAVNVGSAGAPVLFNGALGTPSSGTVTNLTGTASININGTVGATTPSTGAFTTLSASGAVTLSGGTANGVPYLNGSKVVTSGSALTFDGTNFATTGSVTSAGSSNSGNLAFTGTGNRITGDFSNATVANRVIFQSSTTNGNTGIQAIPNGTAVQTQYALYTDPAITNGNYGDLTLNNSEFRLRTNSLGTGTAVPMTFSTGGSERMRVDTSGNLGIGTSSPSSRLEAVGANSIIKSTASSGYAAFYANAATGNAAYHFFGVNGTETARIYSDSANYLAFSTGSAAAEQMRLNSTGMGIGTATPSYKLDVNGVIATGSGSNRGFFYNDGSKILLESSSTYPLAFSVNGSERARIDSSGNLLVGATSSNARLHVQRSADLSQTNAHIQITGNGYAAYHFLDATAYYIGQDSTIRNVRVYSQSAGSGVNLSPNATSWGTFSDERLKFDIEPIAEGLAKLENLRCVSYRLKNVDAADSKKKLGLIAQDLVGVVDEVIDTTKLVDDEADYLSVRYAEMVPVLIKAIQEQQAIITALTARVSALESN
jgi:hypothetical protein